MRTQVVKDNIFADALERRDKDALAAECERRLTELPSGGSLIFKLGFGEPTIWRQPVWDRPTTPPFKKWGQEAASALLSALKE